MADAFLETIMLETTLHPNGRSQMVDAILKIIVLETIVYSNGRCTLGNNSVVNNSAC
jgi:hypothetical protein